MKKPKKITIEWLLKKAEGTSFSRLFQIISDGEDLENIPRKLLTRELLNVSLNESQETALHLSARTGQLKLWPKGLITKEDMALLNKFGENALYYAALTGCLHKVPKRLMSSEGLLGGNNIVQKALEICLDQEVTGSYRATPGRGKDAKYAFSFLTPRNCMKYAGTLRAIKTNLEDRYSGEYTEKIDKLLYEIKVLKKLDKIPSLKI